MNFQPKNFLLALQKKLSRERGRAEKIFPD